MIGCGQPTDQMEGMTPESESTRRDDVPDVPRPQDGSPITQLVEHLPATRRGQSAILVCILVLLVGYTLYAAAEVISPMLIAVLLNLLLSPLVYRLRRLGIPEAAGAAAVVVGLLALLGWGGYGLSGPAADWVTKAPQNFAQLEDKVRELLKPVEDVQRATQQVEQLATVGGGAVNRKVTIRDQTWGEWLVAGSASVTAQIFIVIILLYFLLASGDLFMRRLVKALSTGKDKRRAVEIVHAVQRDVSTYLSTVTLINTGLGLATGLAMWALGMPNPVLWGVMAGLFNFVPYVGAMVTLVVLAVVGLMSFDDLGRALAAPALFFVLTNIEAYVVTPLTLGGRLTLNPALVFVALVVWSWLWGVSGAILAVPLLVTLKAFADHLDSWQIISVFLGRRD